MRRRRLGVAVLAVCTAMACGALTGSSADDSGGGSDGGSDGALPDGATWVCGDAGHTFCDDFDQPLADGAADLSAWDLDAAGQGGLSLFDGGATTPPFSLRVLTNAKSSVQIYATRSLPEPTQGVHCGFDAQFAAFPGDPGARVFTLHFDNDRETAYVMLYGYPAAFHFGVRRDLEDGAAAWNDVDADLDVGQATGFVRVEIDVLFNDQTTTAIATVGGLQLTESIPRLGPPTNLGLIFGVKNNTLETGPDGGLVDVRLDTLACDVR
jgi:hypothetical protein